MLFKHFASSQALCLVNKHRTFLSPLSHTCTCIHIHTHTYAHSHLHAHKRHMVGQTVRQGFCSSLSSAFSAICVCVCVFAKALEEEEVCACAG